MKTKKSFSLVEPKAKSLAVKGEKAAVNSWGKRWIAHICDACITLLLAMAMFSAIFAIAGPCGYNAVQEQYDQASQTKLDFLVDMGIMQSEDSGITDEDIFEDFIFSTLPGYEGDEAKDVLENYYLVKAKTLTQATGDDVFQPQYEIKSYDTLEEYYNQIIVPGINEATGHEMFLWQDDAIVLNDTEGSAGTSDNRSIREQLCLYMGLDPLTGEKLAHAQITDYNSNLYAAIYNCYMNLRQEAAGEAICSEAEWDNEVALSLSSVQASIIRSICLVVAWFVASALYYGICHAIFGYGRTVGKRILGYYVCDKNRVKARWYQILGRDAIVSIEDFWIIFFGFLMVFGIQGLNAPLFLYDGYKTFGAVWLVVISLLLYLLSSILAFILRTDMSSLHDLGSHTVCIKLEEAENIKDHLHVKPKKTNDIDIEELEKNLEVEE